MIKKLFLFLLVLLILSFSLSSSRTVHAQMTLGEIRAKVDAKLVSLWNTILLREIAHYQMYGRYFQGIITHDSIPADGNDDVPDNLGAHPTDQKTNWIDFFDTDLPNVLPMALVIDTYDGPEGSGFTATVYVYALGDLYSRSKAIGPEKDFRTKGWHIVQ